MELLSVSHHLQLSDSLSASLKLHILHVNIHIFLAPSPKQTNRGPVWDREAFLTAESRAAGPTLSLEITHCSSERVNGFRGDTEPGDFCQIGRGFCDLCFQILSSLSVLEVAKVTL